MAAPAFLKKEYGPFTGGVWIVVIVGGVGLGLVLRRFMNNRPGDSEPTTAPNYGVETGAPAFMGSGGGSLYNQGDIVNDVIEAIRAQEPPPATTDPEVDPVPTVPVPVPLPMPRPPTPAPTPAPTPTPTPAPATRTYTVVRGDTLRGIAQRLLGDANRNVEIRKLNPQHTKSWDHLDIGEVLKIPAK